RGIAFPDRSCALRERVGEENRSRGIVRRGYPFGCSANSRACSPAFFKCTPVSRDHGAVYAHTAVHGLSAQGGGPIRVGDLSLDRWDRSLDLGALSHLRRIPVSGFLVHLAG